jgi:foldase protein PrsA
MKRARAARLILAVGAVLVPAGLVAGCGGVPGNAVAEVDGTTIQKTSFDHWLGVAAKSSGQANAAVPDPPNFAACVAAKQKAAPKPAKGQKAPSAASLKSTCSKEYDALRNQVVDLLVNLEWIQGEAEAMGIKVSDADVKKSFDQQRKQSFPKDADYRKFLKQSGQTEADILTRVKADQLATKIRERVIKGKDKVTDAQIKAYYDKNRQQFARPESRDLRIVLTKSKARAEQAQAALGDGASFKTVARRFSIDDASKGEGGRLPGVQKGQQEKALDAAIFAADRGELTGPVRTQFGWYVFKVSKITKADQQSLQEARTTIRQVVSSENQNKALETWVKDFQERWRDRTDCREGFETQSCSNGPEPTPTPDPSAQQQAPTPQPGN